ncbi:hypothetical protein ACFFSH_38875 [Streptomyces filamentosus]|uniref:HTH cro/C1-type domain-containing protein n=1 Tax=Streptomyces filamentosus TaxID=67294 RepID=A0A919BQD9_STRFL|nr:hypothetical protein [Streptomyces filamentosus]GHG05178.1 hypothetical protein GCM10017667_39930 [Streptomyces filamentosus]
MEAVDAPPGGELAALITAINELLPLVGMTHGDLELEAVSFDTGIAEELILALLRGEQVPDNQLNLSFTDRLAFLRETRSAPDGKPYSYAYIAGKIGVSRGMVWALFTGEREAGRTVAASLEEFFGADPGFLSTSGRRALARALRPIHASLLTLNGLRGEGIRQLAMRSSIEGADIRLAGPLQRALTEAFVQSRDEPDNAQDQELREITDHVRALPPTPRKRLIDKMRGLLGHPLP